MRETTAEHDKRGTPRATKGFNEAQLPFKQNVSMGIQNDRDTGPRTRP